MVLLNAIYARNYKSYKEVVIPISKFNVFIGKNSAGKSALIRLVPFILSSLNLDGGDVIDLSPLGIDMGADYSDIVHGHSEFSQMSLGASFNIGPKDIGFVTEITYSTELKRIVVSKFRVACDDEFVFELTLNLESLEKKGGVFYNLDGKPIDVIFNGILPDFNSISNTVKGKYTEYFNLLSIVKYFDFNLSYLGPTRKELDRTFTRKIMRNLTMGERGQFAPYVFKYKEEQSNGLLGNKIKEWMQPRFNGKYFILRSYDKSFSVFCSGKAGESNILDEGVGFAQIFPSIINRAVRDLDKIKGIEMIEQPELHMHPAACGCVADLYLSAINNNIVLVETHSKEFVLRVRRRIAEGIDKKEVNIIYIFSDAETSKIEEIIVDNNGGVKNWPVGIFEEDFDEVMALQEANNKK